LEASKATALTAFNNAKATRDTAMKDDKDAWTLAKNALKQNTDAIAGFEATIASATATQAEKDQAQTDLTDAQGETAGLQSTYDTKFDAVKVNLVAEGLDDQWLKQGAELEAYEKWQTAKQEKENATDAQNLVT